MEDIKKRLAELADRSFNGGRFVFTDFMSLAELAEYYEKEKELYYAHPVLFGGTEISERKMIRFGDEKELGYSEDFPILALIIRPVMSKFADDLTHRDFLGALMNLGIKREMLGDIFVKENEACVFCKDTMADYIAENLTRVKNTQVKVEISKEPGECAEPVLKEKVIHLASERADAVIARVYNLSREDSSQLFRDKLVFINGRECTENAKLIKNGDLVSVRGKGRFKMLGEPSVNKKGRLNCTVGVYV